MARQLLASWNAAVAAHRTCLRCTWHLAAAYESMRLDQAWFAVAGTDLESPFGVGLGK